MKTRNNINIGILVISLFLCVACSKPESDQYNELNGEWHLTIFECCDLPKEEFNRNDIVWLYDTSKQNVTISNNTTIDNSSQYNFTESAVYNSKIIEKEITIYYKERERRYNYSITNATLVLSNSTESDGSRLIFER